MRFSGRWGMLDALCVARPAPAIARRPRSSIEKQGRGFRGSNQPDHLERNGGDDVAGICSSNFDHGKCRRVLALEIQGSAYASGSARGGIRSGALAQPAHQILRRIPDRNPCLKVAGRGAQDHERMRRYLLRLGRIEVVELDQFRGRRARPDDEIGLRSRRTSSRGRIQWRNSSNERLA